MKEFQNQTMPSNNKKWINMEKPKEVKGIKDNKYSTSHNFQMENMTIPSKKSINTEHYQDLNTFNYVSYFSNKGDKATDYSPYLQDRTKEVKQQPTKFYPLLNSSKQKRPISTTTLMRPPSRHKTPNKALGLDTNTDETVEVKVKVNRKRPNTSKVTRTTGMDAFNCTPGLTNEADQFPDNSPFEPLMQATSPEQERTTPSSVNNMKFSSTTQDHFQKGEEEKGQKTDNKMQKTLQDGKDKTIPKDKLNKKRKSHSMANEYNSLKSSLNQDFLDLFAKK